MKSLSLRKNFSWTLCGQLVYAATQWGIITLLARQGTPAMVGEYALALAIAGPIVIFLNLKLRAVQASDARDEYAFADYFGLRLLTSVVAALLIIAIALWGEHGDQVRITIIALAIAKSFESVSDILFGLQQKHERMDLVARSMITKGLLSLLGFYLGFTLTSDVYGGAIGVALSWLVTLLLIDIPFARRTLRLTNHEYANELGSGKGQRFLPRFQWTYLRSLIWLTVPLGITVSLGSLSTNIPRYFIESILGPADLGVYAAMIYPLTASGMIISALAQSATPRLSSSFQSGKYEPFRGLLVKLVALGLAIGIAGILVVMVFGQQIIQLLYGDDYIAYNSIFIWVMVNAAIRYAYLFLGTALNAMRQFRVQLPIHVISVSTLTLLCWFFIREWGLNGALAALTVTVLLEALLYVGIVLRGIRTATAQSQQASAATMAMPSRESGATRRTYM